MEHESPEVFVLAGPNGAGKTTVAGTLLADTLGVETFVNADLIAQALSPHAPQASAFRAGRLMIERIRSLRHDRRTFGFETTLSSRSFVPFLDRAREDGYVVHLLFVFLRSPELATLRVRQRVEKGGHDVPESTIRRRYARGLSNFFHLFLPLADSWTVCDNSAEALTFLARGGADTKTIVLDAEGWEQVRRQESTHAGG